MNASRAKTRRRIIGIAIVSILGSGCALAAPTVLGTLRYGSLVSEHRELRAQMVAAVDTVAAAQDEFHDAATDSLTAHAKMTAFLDAVRPDLLTDRAPLEELATIRAELERAAGMFEKSYNLGVKVVFDTAPAPRIPGATDPVTVDGLVYAIDRANAVVDEYTGAAAQFEGHADDVRAIIDRGRKLMEDTLASAAKCGKRQLVKNFKATSAVRARMPQARPARPAERGLTVAAGYSGTRGVPAWPTRSLCSAASP